MYEEEIRFSMPKQHLFRKGLEFILYSNLLIATAAAAQVVLTYTLFSLPHNGRLVWIEFSSTLLFYNLALYLSLPKNGETKFPRTRWVLQHPVLFYGFSTGAFLIFSYQFLGLDADLQWGFAGVGFAALLYIFPFFKTKNKWINLRSMPYTKIFFIAFIWTASTFYLPFLDSRFSVKQVGFDVFLLGLHRFIFLMMCTIPFDMRDVKTDRYYKLKTLPVFFGEKRTMTFVHLLGAVHIVMSFMLDIPDAYKWTMVLADLLLLFIFDLWALRKHSYNSTFVFDFLLIVQFAAVFFGAVYLS